MNALLKRAARSIEIVLALIFGAGVVLKAMDINLFAVQIAGYGVLEGTTALSRAALATLLLECFITLMLLLGPSARNGLYGLVTAMLVVFTGLIAYGWIFHNLEDCGCFGPLEMSPAMSIGKNVLLLLLTLAAWRGFALRAAGAAHRKRDTGGKVAVAVIASLAVVLGVSTTLEKIDEQQEQPFAEFQFATDTGFVDLGDGTHLVALLSAGCDHCKAEVPVLNALTYVPELPQLVGLCYEEFEGQIDQFRNETFPEFPLHSLGTRTLLFFSLLGDEVTEPPRLVLVEDGAEVRGWTETPDPAMLIEALGTPPEG